MLIDSASIKRGMAEGPLFDLENNFDIFDNHLPSRNAGQSVIFLSALCPVQTEKLWCQNDKPGMFSIHVTNEVR